MLRKEQVNGALFSNGRSAGMWRNIRLAVMLLTVCITTPVLVRTAYAEDNVWAIGALHVENSQPGILELSWNPPTETPLDYRVNWAPVGEEFPSEDSGHGNAYPTSPAFTIAGLSEGVSYKVEGTRSIQ